MSIFENTILVNKKASLVNTIGRIITIALLIMFLGLTFSPIAPGLFLAPAIIMGVIFYFLHLGSQTEYEYTYIEGRLSFAKIKAKRRRKELAKIEMEEVLLLAPEKAPELNSYHNGQQKAVCKNYTSGYGGREIYEVVYKLGEGIGIIRFEPDLNMLEMMQPRNMRKVIIGNSSDKSAHLLR